MGATVVMPSHLNGGTKYYNFSLLEQPIFKRFTDGHFCHSLGDLAKLALNNFSFIQTIPRYFQISANEIALYKSWGL